MIIQTTIRIEKSTPNGIVITGLEIIPACFNIVIVPSITERIVIVYDVVFKGSIARNGGYNHFTKRGVCVSTNLFTRRVIDRYNVTLQVLFEEETVKYAVCVVTRAIL